MTKYLYYFDVWPDETWNHPRALFDFFRIYHRTVEKVFTEDEFQRFRSEMGHAGFTLRGVTRRLYTELEAVII